MNNPTQPRNSNSALWACAGILGLNMLLGASGINSGLPANAAGFQSGSQGQPGTTNMPDPPFNAADQRKRMIEQLTMINDKLARLEAKMDKGISVKVLEMPGMKKEEK